MPIVYTDTTGIDVPKSSDHIGTPALDDSPGVLLKAGEAYLTSCSYHNTTAADAYIQIFDAVQLADVTLGTTVADYVIVCKAHEGDGYSFPIPIKFALGICVFSTTAHDGSAAAIVDVWWGIG